MLTTLAKARDTQEFRLALRDAMVSWSAGVMVAAGAGLAARLVIGSVRCRITRSEEEPDPLNGRPGLYVYALEF
ncbi:hypothetical protein HEP87_02445 [Streptomyces sp. S1D4-11]|nr:hypothetical protein [Streptomyces sp. S1D4-11]QIY93247.1 hypothetical protein HEP87_02445 [Streptomyces sp. S1D4-11]